MERRETGSFSGLSPAQKQLWIKRNTLSQRQVLLYRTNIGPDRYVELLS